MSREPCMCGATDCPTCGPLQGYSTSPAPTERDYELALETIVETVMHYGVWPQPKKGEYKKPQFDLYQFLLEERDASYFLELYLGCITCADVRERTKREQKNVTEMLMKHFKDSEYSYILEKVACEYAEDMA